MSSVRIQEQQGQVSREDQYYIIFKTENIMNKNKLADF